MIDVDLPWLDVRTTTCDGTRTNFGDLFLDMETKWSFRPLQAPFTDIPETITHYIDTPS